MKKIIICFALLLGIGGVITQSCHRDEDSLDELLKGKTVSFIGDSISTFGDDALSHYKSNGTTTAGLVSGITTKDSTWWGVFLKKTGGDLKVADGYSGSVVSGTWSNSWAFSRIEGKDHSADYIFILMGTNDANKPDITLGNIKSKGSLGNFSDSQNLNYQEFTSAYQIGLEKMIAKYPKSKIILLTLVPAFENGNWKPGNSSAFNSRIIELARLYNLDYIDLAKININSYNKSEYLLDGLHPNKTGMELIGNYLAYRLKDMLYR